MLISVVSSDETNKNILNLFWARMLQQGDEVICVHFLHLAVRAAGYRACSLFYTWPVPGGSEVSGACRVSTYFLCNENKCQFSINERIIINQ